MRTYLDHNATSPLRPEARTAMMDAFEILGNTVSLHAHGRDARKITEDGREAVALEMGVCVHDLIFMGSGTEADNTAIMSAFKSGCKRMFVAEMDHPATVNAAQACGAEIVKIPCNIQGQTDVSWLSEQLDNWDESQGRPFVSVVAANSETGVVQDIEAVSSIVEKANGLLLVDAVQAMGKIAMPIGADYVAVSAHKIGGPQGVGALYVAEGAPFTPLIHGGGHEKRRRAGTLNVAGIAGFGAAAKASTSLSHLKALRDRLEAGLKSMEPELTIFGETVERLPNTTFFAVPDKPSQTLLMALDMAGISVSTGTACSSGVSKTSRVVRSMGLEDKAPQGALRVSLGYTSTDADVDRFLESWAKIRRATHCRMTHGSAA